MAKKRIDDPNDLFPGQEFFVEDNTAEEITDIEPVPVDSFEIVWYKEKYQTSLVRNGDDYFLSRVNEPFLQPVILTGLLRELGIEDNLEVLQTQLWVRGLALQEQLEKLSQARLAELVEDVRKRNK